MNNKSLKITFDHMDIISLDLSMELVKGSLLKL